MREATIESRSGVSAERRQHGVAQFSKPAVSPISKSASRRRGSGAAFALACAIVLTTRVAWPAAGYMRDANWVHDPSTIAACNGEYWVFSTGPGIVSRHSKDLTNWDAGPRVFTTPPAWTKQTVPGNTGYFWAPDIIQLGDGYYLYYSVSTWGSPTSAIGLATSPTLDPGDPRCAWTDRGPVIQSRRADNFNAIDPAVTKDAAGNLWLAFGSFWSGIKLVQLNPATGLRAATNSPIYALAWHDTIEAASIARHGDHYFLFVNWGLCCRGTNSTYEIRVGRSAGITGPYLDRDGKDMARGGGSLLLGTQGSFVGPGHAGVFSAAGTNWLGCHFYDADHRGRATLAVLPLQWTADGWPAVAAPRKHDPASDLPAK